METDNPFHEPSTQSINAPPRSVRDPFILSVPGVSGPSSVLLTVVRVPDLCMAPLPGEPARRGGQLHHPHAYEEREGQRGAEHDAPLRIEREGAWDATAPDGQHHAIPLPLDSELGSGEIYVPPGWFEAGGDPEAVDAAIAGGIRLLLARQEGADQAEWPYQGVYRVAPRPDDPEALIEGRGRRRTVDVAGLGRGLRPRRLRRRARGRRRLRRQGRARQTRKERKARGRPKRTSARSVGILAPPSIDRSRAPDPSRAAPRPKSSNWCARTAPESGPR